MRILLIANHHTRHGRQSLDEAIEVLSAAGHSVLHQTVARGRETGEVIRNHHRDVDAVVLGGGDGTVHESAAALIETALPVGLLPMGTANDLARAVRLPLDIVAAAKVIAAGSTRRIDVGEVNGTFFFNVAHIGLGAELAGGLTGAMKKSLGPFAYTLAAARVLLRLRPFRAELITEGERLAIRTIGITVGNGRYFGGTGIVAEDAEIDDGLFHVFALQTKNPFRIIFMLPSILRGTHGESKAVQTLVASQIEVRTVRNMKIRADGKAVGETPGFFRVRPAALSVFAPADGGSGQANS